MKPYQMAITKRVVARRVADGEDIDIVLASYPLLLPEDIEEIKKSINK